jgi:thymidylate kinase
LKTPTFIEFIGLPGSGKTTLHRMTREYLEKVGYKVWTPDDFWKETKASLDLSRQGPLILRVKNRAIFLGSLILMMPSVFKYCLGRIRFISTLAVMLFRYPDGMLNRLILAKFFLIDLFQYSHILDQISKGEKIVLLDEGLFQRAYSIFACSPHPIDRHSLIRYTTDIDLQGLLVFVSADLETCFERIEDRGRPFRLRNESPQRVFETLEKGRRIFSALCEMIESRESMSTEMVRVDGDFLDKAFAQLKTALPPAPGRS